MSPSADLLRALFATHGVETTIAMAPLRWDCPEVPDTRLINQPAVQDPTLWVRAVQGGFWEIAKEPCRLAGHHQPPFRVELPSGAEIEVFEIEAGDCHG